MNEKADHAEVVVTNRNTHHKTANNEQDTKHGQNQESGFASLHSVNLLVGILGLGESDFLGVLSGKNGLDELLDLKRLLA